MGKKEFLKSVNFLKILFPAYVFILFNHSFKLWYENERTSPLRLATSDKIKLNMLYCTQNIIR